MAKAGKVQLTGGHFTKAGETADHVVTKDDGFLVLHTHHQDFHTTQADAELSAALVSRAGSPAYVVPCSKHSTVAVKPTQG